MGEQEPTRLNVPYLRAWRIKRVLSQRQLAKQAGIGVSTIIRLEQGERANFLTLHKLAQGLNLTVEQLLNDNPNEEDLRGVA